MRTPMLQAAAIGLAVLLAFQVVLTKTTPELETAAIASFAEAPQSMEETAASAEQVVLGRVTRVRRGPDIVIPLPGEPEGEDRISTEIATVQVTRTYKAGRGGPPEQIEVLRPGLAQGAESIALEEDPQYQQGERYLLFVKPGLELSGQRFRRIVAPAGRYRIRNDDTVEPMARGTPFAEALRGRRLGQLEEAVNRGVERSGGKGKAGG